LTINRKSRLAIECAHKLRKEAPDTWVFWITASSPAEFEDGLQNIAKNVKMPGWDEPEITQIVYDWLCSEASGCWLLIVDDVGDSIISSTQLSHGNTHDENRRTGESFSVFLTQVQRGAILITSRSEEIASQIHETAENMTASSIENTFTWFDEDQRLRLLQNKLKRRLRDDTCRRLLRNVETPLDIIETAKTFEEAFEEAAGAIEEFVQEVSNGPATPPASHEQSHTRQGSLVTDPDPISRDSVVVSGDLQVTKKQKLCGICRQPGHRKQTCKRKRGRDESENSGQTPSKKKGMY
jgi:hypothetical protein